MNPTRIEKIKEQLKDLPQSSGVYLMKNKVDRIIYVGKAKNLRARVKSYFQDSKDIAPKTKLLVTHIEKIEFILTQTEVEAYLLEASLIKKHKPKYNILLKDDKSYPYIRFSMKDDFPRIYLARKVKKDGSKYFGPFTSGRAVHQTIRFLNQTFQIRDCSDHFMKKRTRPCITYQIGRCTAPCVNYISKEDYRESVKNALQFVQGKNKKILKNLHEKMAEASRQERFEQAAKIRDNIFSIEHILEKQTVVNEKEERDQDVICFFGDERGVTVEVLSVRHGRVLASRPHFLKQINVLSEEENPNEWLASFVNQYYDDNYIPDEVIAPTEVSSEVCRLLKKVLEERAEKHVEVQHALNENENKLSDMCLENAKEHFKDHIQGTESKIHGLSEIQKKLHLPELPRRIECYDISHFQGAETVASQVVFEDGVSNADQYRRYKLRNVQGVNDFESMKEVLERRLKHSEWDDPQLILIDGGKGQLNIAFEVLKELNRTDIPVASLAKARTKRDFENKDVETSQERFFLPGRSNYITFRENSEAFKILVSLRDEAHRFAITYHRKLRDHSMFESILDEITGLGEKRKQTLLTKFSSIEAIKNADISEIASLEGFSQKLAESILAELNNAEVDTAEE